METIKSDDLYEHSDPRSEWIRDPDLYFWFPTAEVQSDADNK